MGGAPQFAALLRKLADQLDTDTLTVRGKKVTLPEVDMEHKISHKNELGANRFTITIEWLDS
ncbi:hypothetical protein GC093_30010 [Paenibacillus sp. LMG 31456]|uniref:Amphi-Trp domain-containing protein n=1 Tax=Paenibacillus foliorum TaxID=2654974 RepID=A0A972H0Y3_9BACL|nr:hypothetical protein [Paenibacillus foliorum]NOU97427.1 hypothetical protein [Paenibacillus foliorum]